MKWLSTWFGSRVLVYDATGEPAWADLTRVAAFGLPGHCCLALQDALANKPPALRHTPKYHLAGLDEGEQDRLHDHSVEELKVSWAYRNWIGFEEY